MKTSVMKMRNADNMLSFENVRKIGFENLPTEEKETKREDALTEEELLGIFQRWAGKLALDFDAEEDKDTKEKLQRKIGQICNYYNSIQRKIAIDEIASIDSIDGKFAKYFDVFYRIPAIKFKANSEMSVIETNAKCILTFSDFVYLSKAYDDKDRKTFTNMLHCVMYNYARAMKKENEKDGKQDSIDGIVSASLTWKTFMEKHSMTLTDSSVSKNKVKEQWKNYIMGNFFPCDNVWKDGKRYDIRSGLFNSNLGSTVFPASNGFDSNGNSVTIQKYIGANYSKDGTSSISKESTSTLLNAIFPIMVSNLMNENAIISFDALSKEMEEVKTVDSEDGEHSITDNGKPMHNTSKLGGKGKASPEKPTEDKARRNIAKGA